MVLQTKVLRSLMFMLFCWTLISGSYAQIRVENAPLIIKQNGKYGVHDKSGNVVVEPLNDTVYASGGKYTHLELISVNPFFILKRGNKLAYAYCLNQDSLGNRLPENKSHWEISDFVYEHITQYNFESETYDDTRGGFRSRPYLVLSYKKNGKWGLMYLKSGESQNKYFTSSGSYPAGLGELRMTEAKYDTIAGYFTQEKYTTKRGYLQESGVYAVKSNGKFELLEVIYRPIFRDEKNMSRWSNALYKDGGFDTIPLKIERKLYVRKNGKWGHVVLHHETKTMEYKVPCMCNALFRSNENVFYCGGEKDTLKIYNARTKITVTPKPAGKPIVCTFFWSGKKEDYRIEKYIGSNARLKEADGSMYMLSGVRQHSFLSHDSLYRYFRDPEKSHLYDNISVYSLIQLHGPEQESDSISDMCYHNSRISGKKVYAFELHRSDILYSFADTNYVYSILSSGDFLIKARYDESLKTYTREFFDAKTGEYKFRIESPDKYFYIVDEEHYTYKPDSDKIDHYLSTTYVFKSNNDPGERKKFRNLGKYDTATGQYKK